VQAFHKIRIAEGEE
jgi:uncharacterized membrane protein